MQHEPVIDYILMNVMVFACHEENNDHASNTDSIHFFFLNEIKKSKSTFQFKSINKEFRKSNNNLPL